MNGCDIAKEKEEAKVKCELLELDYEFHYGIPRKRMEGPTLMKGR